MVEGRLGAVGCSFSNFAARCSRVFAVRGEMRAGDERRADMRVLHEELSPDRDAPERPRLRKKA
jgi:hypothetical protein